MEKTRRPFVRWNLQCWCVDAAQRDKTAAAFLLDRFEVAARILCPGPETARTVH